MNRNRRKSIFVIKGFQIRYIVYAMLFIAAASFMVWWETYATISYTFKSAGMMNLKVQDFLSMINKVVIFKMAVMVGIMGILAMFLSHLVAGPLHQLKKAFNAVAEGDLTTKISFRKFDELKEIENAFNAMTESLRTKLVVCKKISEELKVISKNNSDGAIDTAKMSNLNDVIELLDKISNEIKVTLRP